MKIIYDRNDKINAPAENLPEQQISNENNNISYKELLVIFMVSLLIFPVCILIQNIIKLF